MKGKTILLPALGFLLLLPSLFAQSLNSTEAKSIYGDYLSRNGREQFDLSKVEFKWETGAFVGKGSRDAILKVEDMDNMSHADGWNKLFLLCYQNGWKLAEELEANDSVDFRVMDLQKDGILEVWIESSHMGMGYQSSGAKLLSLAGGKSEVLYENSGSDPSGAAGENDAYETEGHEVSFRDLDGDGTLELIDRHVTGKYQNRNYEAIELSKKIVETTLKLANDRFVPWKAPAAAKSPAAAAGQGDLIGFAKQEIERLKMLWTPLFYSATFGVYQIGGRIVMSGGGYLLLESPAIAIDLVSGGFCKVASSLTRDAALALIEQAVKAPRKVCTQIAREVIQAGWREYLVAYETLKKYRRDGKLTPEDAAAFLMNRDGAEKMTLGKVLYNKIASVGHAVDQVLAEKAGRELTEMFTKKYQQSLGMGKTLPLAEEAFFIKDVHDILQSRKTGLLAYPPYIDFNAKMEAINRRRLEEAKKYYSNFPAVASSGSNASPLVGKEKNIPPAPDKPAAESFMSFFDHFRKDANFQLERIEFPLKYIVFDPTDDNDPGKTTLIQRSEWKHQGFQRTETDIWGDPEVKGGETVIRYQRAETGVSISHHFRLVSGKWHLWKIEDWSI